MAKANKKVTVSQKAKADKKARARLEKAKRARAQKRELRAATRDPDKPAPRLERTPFRDERGQGGSRPSGRSGQSKVHRTQGK